MTRMLEIATKAGANAFVVQRFSGHEELGRLYEYSLELLSERGDITADQLLGTNATVALELPGGKGTRVFNGYITRFTVQGVVRTPAYKSSEGFLYLVTLSPGLWFMTRASDSKIYADYTIGDVIMQKLQADTLMTAENSASDTEMRNYITQYRETDFNFISRLAEHAGVYYYFTHTDGAHAIRLLNKSGDHKPTPDLTELKMIGTGTVQGTLDSLRLISEVQPGAFSTGDYNYAKPNTQLAAVDSNPASHDNAGYEIYDHPIDATESGFVTTYAKIRGEELACRHAVVRGAGPERGIQVGFKVTVSGHSVKALNAEYMVISHSFSAANGLAQSGGVGAGSTYQCEFEAIPAGTQFRPARISPRPIIAGTQSALVVADFRNDGDSDTGGNLGRVKVRFYWDRYGSESCWARVSSPWAGKGYGFQNMPRVGEEVLVQFLEGDPDRPVVIGRVHNAENLPPFDLPAGANYTGLKSLSIDSTGTSVAGRWSELRFDDTSNAEQVYLQAQNDFDKRVLHDDKSWIGGESHNYIKGDAYDQYDADHHVQTTGDHNESIKGKLSFDITEDIHLKSGTMFVVDGGKEVHLKATSKIVLESPAMVSLVCGGNFVTVGPSGVDIKGMLVNVNTGGSKGSGSAISPQKPKDGKKAMTSAGGSPPKTPLTPTPPTAFSPKASSFVVAAQTAAPFVASNCPG